MGLQCQLLEWVGVSAVTHWGRNGVYPKNQLLGGTCWSEGSEGLSADSWSRPCAWCWGSVEGNCLHVLQTRCACVIHQHTSSWTLQRVGGAGSGMRYQVVGGSVLDKYVSAVCLLVSIKLDQPASRGPMGQVRVSGIQAGVPGGQRGHAGTWQIHKYTCTCEPR